MPSATSIGMSPSEIQQALRQGRGLLLFEAIVCLIGGLLAMAFPVIVSEGLEVFLGFLCAFLGVLGLVRCVVGGTEHLGSTAVTSVLMLILGALLLIWPFGGLEALTLLLAAASLVRGFADLFGLPTRSVTAPGLQVLSGMASLILGILLLLWYPSDALWAPGLLFGIQLIFFSLMMFSLWSVVRDPLVDPPATQSSS